MPKKLITIDEHISNAKQIFDLMLSKSKLKNSKGSCLYACIFLKDYLQKFTSAENLIIRGGSENCGVKIDNTWHGHYWIEGSLKNETYVFDITIDQFISNPFLAEKKNNCLIEFKSGNQEIVNSHINELSQDIKKGA